MRQLLLVPLALLACSSSSGAGQIADAGPNDAGAPCLAGMLVLGGTSSQVPHGSYSMSDLQSDATGFSASLPAGGSIELSWTGDAVAGSVAVTGKLYIPADDEGPPTVWCIYAPSTLHISANSGHLVMSMLPARDNACSAASGATLDAAVACFDPAS